MDYKDVAKVVIRSPQTVRKWCPKITALSGYTFDFEIQRRRNGERKIPHFTKEDLTKFKELRQALALSGNFEQSVFKVYGNLKAKRERDLRKDIVDLDDYCLSKFESLIKQINTLKTNNQLLNNRIATLEQFNSRLEKIEIGLRKKNIGELLNDKFKN